MIFDFDGLILDTEQPDHQAWDELFARFACRLPLDRWLSQIGTFDAVFDPWTELEAQRGAAVDREELTRWRRSRCDELIAAKPVQPGVTELIAAARQRGLRLAVASSSPREWVAGHLERLGLLDAFDFVACGDEVPRTKPDPAVYQAALRGLGLEPRQAIALEDSPNGALAASRAGLVCVVVPHPLLSEQQFAADVRLDSLADLDLDALLAAVNARNASRSG
ncbi:MAG TPA: HAD-IA family hydrolase [Thermomicrobiaceae bacterium]|nr:HAD-IA family hydrolase [Thermomicrobiaceae bacterium]